MRRFVLAFIVLLFVAGCTQLPGGDPDTTKNDTDTDRTPEQLVISSRLGSSQIFEGSSTELILTAENGGDVPVTEFQATVANTGDLQLVREVPTGSSTQAPETNQCFYEDIPVPSGSFTVPQRCIWTVLAPLGTLEAGIPSQRFPLTVYSSYSSAITMNDQSVEARFVDDDDLAPGDIRQQVASARNRDVMISMEYRDPLIAARGAIPLTITVRNVGDGQITGEEGGVVTLSFSGTLMEEPLNRGETTCLDGWSDTKTITIPEGAQQRMISCEFSLQTADLAGKTFFLKARGMYDYQVSHDVPLEVVQRD